MDTMLSDDPISAALFPKARRVVLGLLYGHPDQSYYLRQIVELTGLGVGHVQREVNRLAEAGILQRSRVGRHVFFQADETCPIYEELRGMVIKTVGGAAVIADALQPLADRIEAAFILVSSPDGSVISNAPKRLRPNTRNTSVMNPFTQGLEPSCTTPKGPSRAVVRKPKTVNRKTMPRQKTSA